MENHKSNHPKLFLTASLCLGLHPSMETPDCHILCELSQLLLSPFALVPFAWRAPSLRVCAPAFACVPTASSPEKNANTINNRKQSINPTLHYVNRLSTDLVTAVRKADSSGQSTRSPTERIWVQIS